MEAGATLARDSDHVVALAAVAAAHTLRGHGSAERGECGTAGPRRLPDACDARAGGLGDDAGPSTPDYQHDPLATVETTFDLGAAPLSVPL